MTDASPPMLDRSGVAPMRDRRGARQRCVGRGTRNDIVRRSRRDIDAVNAPIDRSAMCDENATRKTKTRLESRVFV
ncbi:hypothetical protein [Burkholderia thailandensis]|uniref:hypothetical protein n=1 Tax=Burkholderia thailandensis TaxID=57975 RepID=UPI000FD68D0F|nr:hypothetical protein [Burkholderia thailandensis]MCS3398256.1 hypothetical protein [Burkholderia thailandensis]MCS6494486.1 hypothetical protein [Burkholderia thailandensis]MCS6512191.1 hypothetical protein [Burkholderia thailandensis]MCS6516659.1 hypothetical protein [Burkholderia thailandensis]NBC91564.1 hypothetical protein [Burkholderia thailandensis]